MSNRYQVVEQSFGSASSSKSSTRRTKSKRAPVPKELITKPPFQQAQVNRLPAEILSMIFMTYPRLPDGALNNKMLIRISHVCRYWRSIALSTQYLWTHVDFRYGSEVITRSQTLPIHLRIAFPELYTSIPLLNALDSAEWLSRDSDRVQVLDVDAEPAVISKLSAILGEAAEKLDTLCAASYLDPDRRVDVPLFGPLLPNLRHLSLRSVVTNWASVSGLTSLTLEGFDAFRTSSPTLHEITSILIGSPCLESLILKNLDIQNLDGILCTRTVEMPYLRHLYFNNIGSGYLSGHILARLSIPSTAPLLDFKSSQRPLVSMPSWPNNIKLPMSTLHLDFDHDELRLGTNIAPNLRIIEEEGVGLPSFHSLTTATDLSTLNGLAIVNNIPYSHVSNVFAYFNSLRCDRIFASVTTIFLDLYSIDMNAFFTALNSASGSTPFPMLKHIHLVVNNDKIKSDEQDSLCLLVKGFLEKRHAAGIAPPETLHSNFGDSSSLSTLVGEIFM